MDGFGNNIDTSVFYSPEELGQGEAATEVETNNEQSPDEIGQGDADTEGTVAEATTEEGTTEDQGSNEELFAGKFKTVAAMEEAYRNAQSYSTKVAQQLSELKKKTSPTQPVSTGVGNNQQGSVDDITVAITNGIADKINGMYEPIMEKIQMLETKEALSTLAINDSENFKEVSLKLEETVEKNPWLNNLSGQMFIEAAYKLAKSEIMEAKAEAKIKQARQDAYKSKDIKVVNSDNAGKAKVQQNTDVKSEEQQIQEAILAAVRPRF